MADYKPKLKRVLYSPMEENQKTYVTAEVEEGRAIRLFACVDEGANVKPRWYPLYYVPEGSSGEPAFFHNILPGYTREVLVRAEFTMPPKAVKVKAKPRHES